VSEKRSAIRTKLVIGANRQYAGRDEKVDRHVDFLEGLSNSAALQQAGIRLEDFWLSL
jgi:hypothetical protein